MSLVNILWSKQKKKAILIFEESSVDIAAMLNTKKGVTDYAQFNVQCVQKRSKSLKYPFTEAPAGPAGGN